MTDKTNTNRWLVLVIVCVAQFMVVLDATADGIVVLGLLRRSDVATIDAGDVATVQV